MKLKSKPSLGGCVLLFALIHLFEYVIEHVVYLLRDASWSGAISLGESTLSVISLVAEYAVNTTEIVSLGIMALMILVSLACNGLGSAIVLGICMVLTKVLYIFPHYYMTFISYGYDSIEAIIMILPLAAFIIFTGAAILATVVALSSIPIVRSAKRQDLTYSAALLRDAEKLEHLNLGNSLTASIEIASILSAGVHIFIVFLDMAEAIADYGASLPPAVILSLMARFLFLVLVFVALHFILSLIRFLLFRTAGEESKSAVTADQVKEGALPLGAADSSSESKRDGISEEISTQQEIKSASEAEDQE